MSNAVAAINTLLKRGDGAGSETFTTIAEVKSITGPTLSTKVVITTNHSNAVPWEDKKPTVRDAGEISFELNFIPTDPTQDYSGGLLGDFASGGNRNFKLVFPDGGATTWSFTGFVSKFSMSAAVDDVLKASVTITLFGEPTFAG